MNYSITPLSSRTWLFACLMSMTGVANADLVETLDGRKVPDIGPLAAVVANPENRPTRARMSLGRALFF